MRVKLEVDIIVEGKREVREGIATEGTREIHCAIDEEPMKSKYVHGKPYTMAQAGPLPPASTFYAV